MSNKYIYLCGPTIYNKVHIGNMRPIVTFDLILRAKKNLDPNIKFIHNITDIDDKIIQKSIETKRTEDDIVNEYLLFYLDMLKVYNIETIDYMPKVSEKIDLISNFIDELNKKGYVYNSNNSFYFRVNKISSYGEVSNNSLSQLKDDDNNEEKEYSFDFALWKNKTSGKRWKALLGEGRPGWHTECAAFIYEHTKDSLLIHGGGIDLKFPHHENENAQFRALTSKPICEKWLHVGIINYKNQKMSKSLGNIVFADDFVNKYKNQVDGGDLFRLIILSSSVNSTIELSDELFDTTIKKLNQINKIINFVLLNELKVNNDIDKEVIKDLSDYKFSNVFKHLNALIKSFNNNKDIDSAIKIFNLVDFMGFKCTKKVIDVEYIKIFNEWQEHLKNKNFNEADKFRNILIEKNLI